MNNLLYDPSYSGWEPEAFGGWECLECGHVFFTASVSSGDDDTPGVECPECGAFVPDEDCLE